MLADHLLEDVPHLRSFALDQALGRLDGRGFAAELQLLEDEAEILIFGVHPEVRRQGIGQALLEHMRQILETSGCRAIFLEVRKSNVAAISLYQRFGFRETGMRKSYYADNGEDALVMRYDGVRN